MAHRQRTCPYIHMRRCNGSRPGKLTSCMSMAGNSCSLVAKYKGTWHVPMAIRGPEHLSVPAHQVVPEDAHEVAFKTERCIVQLGW